MCLQRNRWTIVTGDFIASPFARQLCEGVDTNIHATHATVHPSCTTWHVQPDRHTDHLSVADTWSQTHTSEDAAWLSGSGAQLVIETFWVRIPVRTVTGTDSYRVVCVTEHILPQCRYDEFTNMWCMSAVLAQKGNVHGMPFLAVGGEKMMTSSNCVS